MHTQFINSFMHTHLMNGHIYIYIYIHIINSYMHTHILINLDLQMHINIQCRISYIIIETSLN